MWNAEADEGSWLFSIRSYIKETYKYVEHVALLGKFFFNIAFHLTLCLFLLT